MKISFVLVLSLVMQLAFSMIVKLLFPSLIGIWWFSYIQIGILSVITVFLPGYLAIKSENKNYFTDCCKDVEFDILIPICVGIGICSQYVGILCNIPMKYVVDILTGKLDTNIPAVNSLDMFIVSLFVLCLMPAIFEETLFRGYIFNHFRKYGDKPAILISSLLFAAMHLDFTNFFGTFALGLTCSYVVSRTNRTIYSVIVHFFMNFTSALSSFAMTNPIIKNIYNDYLLMILILSVPVFVYLLMQFKQHALSYDCSGVKREDIVVEKIIPITEEQSIRIIEHDIKENNYILAFKELFSSLYFYIFIIIFLYIGSEVFFN